MSQLAALRGLFVVPLLVLCSSGCAFQYADHWSAGERGRARFSWGSGWECFFGCDLDRALMVGTMETLRVHPDDWPVSAAEATAQLRAESSDPALFQTEVIPITVDRNEDGEIVRVVPGVLVRALGAGTATIRIYDADDVLVDEAAVVARPAARLLVLTGTEPDTSPPVSLRTSEELTLNARAWDADGNDLSASFGWTFSVDDPSVATLWNNDLGDPSAGTSTLVGVEGFATLQGRAPGDTVLRARVGDDAETSVMVHVE